MNRRALFALLSVALAAVIGLVFFWPGDEPDNHNPEVTGAEEVDLESANPDEIQVSAPVIEESSSKPSGRAESEMAAEKPEASEAEVEKPYAELSVQLFTEDDQVLDGIVVGTLFMPEPEREWDGLQALFFAMQGQAPKGFPLNETRTDEEGRATLPLFEHKYGWVVYGRTPGRLIGFKIVENVERGQTHDAGVLVLARGGTLRVEACDESGNPVAGAGVVLVADDSSDPTQMPIHFLKTDKDGIAEFRSLSFENHKMDVAKRGFVVAQKDPVAITVRGQGTEKVMLLRGGNLTGTVLDHLDQPMEGVTISIKADHWRDRPQGLTQGLMDDQIWATTDAFGKFEGSGLKPDVEYSVWAQPSPEVEVSSSGHKAGDDVTLKIYAVATLSGLVLKADGSPAVSALVGLHSAVAGNNGPPPVTLTTNADGSFSYELATGKYFMAVHHPSGEYFHRSVVALSQDLKLAPIKLPAGGSVELDFFKPDGSPYENAYLINIELLNETLVPAKSRERFDNLHRMRKKDIVKRGTSYLIEGLNPGTIGMRFYSPHYLEMRIEVAVKGGESTKQDVYLVEGGKLNLLIEVGEGYQPHRSVYELRYIDPIPEQFQHLQKTQRFLVNRKGRKTLERLLPGTWAVAIAADSDPKAAGVPGAELQRFSVQPGEQSRTIQVP
jgi:hypothetical protein